MFDVAWTELMVIVILAIIVVGPKDLPRVMRTLGQWARKARAMAAEFRASLDEIAREAELDEVTKAVRQAKDFSPKSAIKKTIDPEGSFDKPFMPHDVGSGTAAKPKSASGGGKGELKGKKSGKSEAKKPDKPAKNEKDG